MEWTVAIGVDTHKHVHVAVALDRFGAQLDSREVATTETGYRALLAWAGGARPARLRRRGLRQLRGRARALPRAGWRRGLGVIRPGFVGGCVRWRPPLGCCLSCK